MEVLCFTYIFWGPRSQVPLEYFGISGPGLRFGCSGSLVLLRHFGVPGLGFRAPTCRRPVSRVPLFRYASQSTKKLYYKVVSFWFKEQQKKTQQRITEKVSNLSGSTRKRGFMIEKGLHNKTFKEDWTKIFPHVTGFLLHVAGYPLLLLPLKKLFN